VGDRAAANGAGGVNVNGRGWANMTLHLFGTLWNFQVDRGEELGTNPNQPVA
jgi:hypothetical protein